MLRPAREVEGLTDDEFADIIQPSYIEIRNYLDNEFIYEFVAKCIATDFKNDSIWGDSNLEYEFRDAMDFLSNMPRFDKINIDKLKKTLEKKHSLKITSANPIRIEKIWQTLFFKKFINAYIQNNRYLI